jgi:hypothetical protein
MTPSKRYEFFAKPEVKEMSAGLEEIAEAVAVAVEDKELRDRIYAKCMEKFDGETNVLWQQLEGDNNLRAKGGWNNRIDDLVSKGRKNTIVKGAGNVDVAVKKFEKAFGAPLHLFWAFPSTWDKKTTPLVAFVPMDGDPEKRASIPAFDAKGNRYDLSKDGVIAKNRPVLVITFNERTSGDGQIRKGLMIMDKNSQRAVPIETLNGGGKGSKSLTAGEATIVTVNWVEVTATNGQIDEPWFGGDTEWIYTMQKDDRYLGWTDNWTNVNLGWYQSRYYPNNTFYVQAEWGVARNIHFKYYEDDFISGQYDIFDDWYGFHQFPGTQRSNEYAFYYLKGVFPKTEAGTTAEYSFW